MKHFTLNITPVILKLIAEIDEFKGSWKLLERLSPERLNSLRKVASIESIGSSTRIEGVKLSDAEITKLWAGLQTTSFTTRDEQEVAGYAEAMNLVYESYAEINVSINHVKQLHRVLLKHSTKDERHAGEFKKLNNDVAAFDQSGQMMGIIFQTASPFDTPRLMTELVDWTEQAFAKSELHPLIIIAVFVVHFLAIHPFQDGNGRLSRIITTLLLLRAGYLYVPYASLEAVVERNKNEYYLTLRETQVTLNSEKYNLEPWLVFFLQSLVSQKNNLEHKIGNEIKLQKLSPLSASLLELTKSMGRITLAEAAKILVHDNKRTVKAHLSRLVREGQIGMHGRGKATFYTLNK